MADWQLRAGVQRDVPLLAAIERAADGLFPAGRLPPGDDTYPQADLAAACDADLLFVAVVGQRVVGFAYCEEQANWLHLAGLAVHPDLGRQGIGAALVERVVEAARARGASGVTLTTFSDIPWNGPFYARMGFREVDDAGALPFLAMALVREHRAGMRHRVAMCLEVI